MQANTPCRCFQRQDTLSKKTSRSRRPSHWWTFTGETIGALWCCPQRCRISSSRAKRYRCTHRPSGMLGTSHLAACWEDMFLRDVMCLDTGTCVVRMQTLDAHRLEVRSFCEGRIGESMGRRLLPLVCGNVQTLARRQAHGTLYLQVICETRMSGERDTHDDRAAAGIVPPRGSMTRGTAYMLLHSTLYQMGVYSSSVSWTRIERRDRGRR